MPLLLGPTSPVIDEIKRICSSGTLHRATVMVAWARTAGVALFLDALGADIGKVRIAVGMAGAGTSVEALSYLRESCAEVYLFHKHLRQTFHPKVYCFEMRNNQSKSAHLVVGSSNLTGGGLFSNFEANLSVSLAPATSAGDRKVLQSALTAFDEVSQSPYSEIISTDERIQVLLDERYLSTEAKLRRKAGEDATHAPRPGNRRGKPEAPPPKLVAPKLPPATFKFRDLASDRPPLAPRPRTSSAANVALVGDGRFFVRTLTANDVAKIKGEQVGTFEPDLGISARGMCPEFWGWPDKFVNVTRKDTRQEWAAAGSAFSSAAPLGTPVEILQWFRPKRPSSSSGVRGHAAEHRLRIGPRRGLISILPAGFGVTSLMIIERLPEGGANSFTIRIIARGEPGYNDYDRYLVQVRTGHRFGYGPNDIFE